MSHTHIVAIRLGWERKSVSHRYQFPGNLEGKKGGGRVQGQPRLDLPLRPTTERRLTGSSAPPLASMLQRTKRDPLPGNGCMEAPSALVGKGGPGQSGAQRLRLRAASPAGRRKCPAPPRPPCARSGVLLLRSLRS